MSKTSHSTTLSQSIEASFTRWLRFVRKFRTFVIAFWIIAAAIGCAVTANFFSINTDTSEMIAEAAPYRQDQIAFESAFSQFNDEIIVIIRAETPDATDLFSEKLLRKLDRSEHTNFAYSPVFDPFFQKNGLLFLETEELEATLAQLTEAAPLIERLALNPTLPSLFDALVQAAEQGNDNVDAIFMSVAETLERNLEGQDKAMSWRSIFVDEIETPIQRIITIDPMLDNTRLRPAAPVQEAIDKAIVQVREETGLNPKVFVTGNPILRSDELQSVSRGIGFAFFISFILVGLLLLWALRSPVLTLFTLLSIIISIMITAGIASLSFAALNLVSIAFTVLMVGLGVDFAIHLLLHLRHESGLGKSTSAAFYRTSRGVGTALVLTAPSTALAFLAFVPTKFIGISQLGVIAAIGVLIAFLVATSLLPAIYTFLPSSKKQVSSQAVNSSSKKRLHISDSLRSRLAIGVMALGLLSVFWLPSARFDADPMALRNKAAPSVTGFNQLFDLPETTPYRLNYLAPNEDVAHSAAKQFETLDTVRSARTIWDFIPTDQSDKLELIDYAAIGLEFAVSGEGEAYPITPKPTGRLLNALEGQTGIAATTLRETLQKWQNEADDNPELLARSERDLLFYWPYELERLRNQIQASEITRNIIPDNIASRYSGALGQARVEILSENDLRDETLRRQFIDDVKTMAPQIAGSAISGSARNVKEAGDIIQRAMLQAIITALILVSLLLYVVVREIKLVIIMLIPLILAGVLTTATGVILGLPYNFANVIVLPLLIGIGVDSSLHLVLQTRQMSKKHSIFDTVTPRAVLFSGFTTIASFGSLTFSEHRGTSSMGALLTISIIWVIICTVFVTPSLMKWFDGGKTHHI